MSRVEALEHRILELEDELRRARDSDARLERSEARLALAAEASGIGLWTWDYATNVLEWDERLCEIFGLTPAQAPTSYEGWREVLHPGDRERVELHAAEAIRSGEYGEIEHRIVRADGAVRWIHALGSVGLDADGKVARLMGAVLDVTDRHDLEERLRDAQKLEAVARLAAGVAHNFNNLLAVVIPSVEEAARLVPEAAPHLEPAREGALQAAAIVRELTRLAGDGQPGVRARCDLGAIAHKAAEFCRRTFDRWIRWEVEVAAALPTVLADASQVEQALVNVLLNARDALRGAPGRGAAITLRAFRDGGNVAVTVTDTGRGMDEGTRGHIFEPFFTTKGPTSGAGLGLLTAYAIVREHGGAIACRSQPGEGTTLTLSFPIGEVAPPAQRPGAWPAELLARGERVLVVDDERLLRRVLRTLLEGAGYEVRQAVDGEEAIALLSDKAERYDAMILDRSMPGVGGVEVMAWVSRERPALRVIGYSGLDKQIAGVRVMLSKPVEAEVLLATLRGVLETP